MKTYLMIAALGLGLVSGIAKATEFPVFDPAKTFVCPVGETMCTNIYPVRPPSQCEAALLTNGQLSLKARIQALKSAKHSFRAQALIFTGDESGLHIANLIKQKIKEGVRVQIIVDSVSNTKWKTLLMYADLKAHGAEIVGDEAYYDLDPLGIKDLNKRYHDKLWIVDGEQIDAIAVMGGMNIANEYFRIGWQKKTRWRDQDVAVKGAIIKDLVTAFDANFLYLKLNRERRGLLNSEHFWKVWRIVVKFVQYIGGPTKIPFLQHPMRKLEVEKLDLASKSLDLKFHPTKARFIQSRPRFGEAYIKEAYVDMIDAAQKEVLICNAYFVPTKEIQNAIIRAGQRGVKVTIMTNSIETNDLAPLTIVGRYLYKRLLAAENVRIFEWQGGPNEGTLHAKYAVFDRQAAIIGSYNLDPRSEMLNSETVLAIQHDEMATQLGLQFTDYDLVKGREITWDEAVKYNAPENMTDDMVLKLSLPLKDLL